MPTQFGRAEAGWVILSSAEARLKAKIEEAGTPLKDWDVSIYRGILTGFNEAFIIDGATREKLISQSPESVEIIHPVLRGRDIKRYRAEFADMWIINTHNGIREQGIERIDVVKHFPSVYSHLLNFEKDLTNRLDKGKHWTNLRNCAYLPDFDKEKIVWIELTDPPKFSLDTSKMLLNNTIFFMVGESLRYILAILNSKVCEWYFDKVAATSGAGTRRWIKMYIDLIVIPIVNNEKQEPFVELVNQIIKSSSLGKPTVHMQKQIDTLAYSLFNLTPVEIGIIEKNSFIKYDG